MHQCLSDLQALNYALTNDIPFLQMEAIQMLQRILRVHHIVKDHKRRALSLCFVPYSDLANATISTKEVIQVLACYLIRQVFNEENAVRARWELGLQRVVRHCSE